MTDPYQRVGIYGLLSESSDKELDFG